jgi:nucleotide-binding universal stress UspA family protein
MLAFDNGPSTHKAVEVLMRGPLFVGLECHLVTVGEPAGDTQRAYDWARDQLSSAGFEVRGGVFRGERETVLPAYQRDHAIDLVVMGAYGHSRIRQLLVGSTTTAMMRRIATPLLLLR